MKITTPKIIAEIGCNHKGDFNIAKKMIIVAASLCRVDIIKFQKRNNKELLTEKEYNSPHPVSENSYGKTYGEHREFLEFNLNQHKELKRVCEKHDVIYSCSVWDLTSAQEIISLNPKMIKIPSACNTNIPLLNFIFKNYNGEIHISLGMTSKKEEYEIVKIAKENKKVKNLVLYACTSSYPSCYEDIYLLELNRLNKYRSYDIKIGFSGHHKGNYIDIAATMLNIDYIERHFTFDRSWKGTDHSASLDPYNLHSLVKNIENLKKALQYKPDKDIPECEKYQREKLKKIIS